MSEREGERERVCVSCLLQKSGEESGTTSESTPLPTPTSTPHHTSPSVGPAPQQSQVQLTYPLTPGAAPVVPPTAHQQYATHYHQPPMGATVPQQPPQARPLFGPPRGQTMTPPIQQANQLHPLPAPPPIPTQAANTPLAFSTLNVNVSSLSAVQQPIVGGVAPPTGSYQYPTSYPTPGGTPRMATPPSGGTMGLQPKSFASGANAYPLQGYNKVMSSFVTGGSGQVGVARPMGIGTAHPRGASVVGRGSVSSTPPRPPHPLPHVRSNLTPPVGYPGQPGHSVPTPPPQTGVPGGGAWPR